MPINYSIFVIIENFIPLIFSLPFGNRNLFITFLKRKVWISSNFWKIRERYLNLLKKILICTPVLVTIHHNLIALIRPEFGEASITHEVYSSRAYDQFYSPKSEQVIIDVGANIGLYTLKSSLEVGSKGLVIAIEPNSNNFALLKRNIDINKLNNIIVANYALCNKIGKTKLYLSSNSGTHSIFLKMSDKFEEVKITTIDQLISKILEKNKLQRLDVVKLDAEGSEYEILKGAVSTLKKYRPRILMETTNKKIRTKCVTFLKELNYSIKILDVYLYAF